MEQEAPFRIAAKAYSVYAARIIGASALAILLTAALDWLRATSAMAGMVFLVLVVWMATQTGRWFSLYIAALCTFAFDFFFLPPYHTLSLAGPQEWVAMFCFVASCLVVSRVAERARLQTQRAEQRQADVERLYELSQEMMLYDDAERLIHDLPRLIHRIFALDDVVLYVCDHDRFYTSAATMPAGLRANMETVSQELNPTLTSIAGYYTAPLTLGLRPVGALAWRPATLSREVTAAVSAQVSIAVARSIAMETTARMEAAREAERLRTALIDSITHELRTPLTSIRAAATTLIQTEALDEAGRRDLVAIIDEEAARLDLLIGEAVEMAEIDANMVQVHMAPQHPRALLDHAVEESRKVLAARTVNVVIESGEEDEKEEGRESPARLNPAQDEPLHDHPTHDKPVWFDAHLLSRVLRHLLENVAAYTPPGSRVTLSSRRVGDRLEFCVEDNGPGIDALDLPLIFEKFYRGRRSTRIRKGSGMGLAITRAILAVHGGGIEAGKTPGGGAQFRFWVPLVEHEPGQRDAENREQGIGNRE